MSKPSFSNIDLWLFELAEGNLSPEQVERLELFILQNPELDIERDMWEFARVDDTPVAYPDAESLERKRRPAAVYASSLLLLLLLTAGSYGLWTLKANSDLKEVNLAEKNQQKLDQLQEEVTFLRGELAKHSVQGVAANDPKEQKSLNARSRFLSGFAQNGIFSIDKLNSIWSNQSNIGVSDSWFASSLFVNGVIPGKSPIDSPIASNFDQFARQNYIAQVNQGTEPRSIEVPINPEYLLLENEFYGKHSPSYVGRDDFHTRAVTEIDYSGEHRWGERTSRVPNVSSRGGGARKLSISKRIKRMSRIIRRMADNPIALRNSRDPYYHVPGMTANDVSFSSAGTQGVTKLQLMSRIQWLGQANEQLMNELAIDGYSYGIRGGWGIQLNHSMYDDGAIHIGQIAFTYSPKFSISNWFSVEPSVRFKMGDKFLNSDLLAGTEQIEIDRGNAQDFYPNGGQIGRNLWYRDLGAGLLMNTKWFFAGIQADNLFRHQDNIYTNDWNDPRRAGQHIVATIGTDWLSRTEEFGLSPYLVYQKKENLSEVWAGANIRWKWLSVGIASSEKLDPAASIGMKFDQFSLHYNADYIKSTMTGERALSHQVTMRFQTKTSRFGQRQFKL